MAEIWCRSCGGPIIQETAQLALGGIPHFDADDLRMNVLMQCVSCVSGRPASPSAKRVSDRILYHLITKGVVRIGFRHSEIIDPPHDVKLDVMTKANEVSARNYIASAVSGISGLRVSTHIHKNKGYILGHLRTEPVPCRCNMI